VFSSSGVQADEPIRKDAVRGERGVFDHVRAALGSGRRPSACCNGREWEIIGRPRTTEGGVMPVGWLGFSIATPPELEELKGDPPAMRDYVQDLVQRAGAQFVDLYFEVQQERAYALVRQLDDYQTTKAVTKILGADEYTKLLDADQAAEALRREQTLRDGGSVSVEEA
jgi:hypothetical protein